MRAYEIRGAFGLDHLVLAERPEPQPGPGQVRIRVHAVSLNFRDLMTVRGVYNPRQKLPLVPCSDGAGVIEAVGAGVTRVAVGDRVTSLFAQRWLGGEPTRERLRSTLGGPADGMLAEQVVLSEDGVVKAPPHLSHEEAATLPCAAVTAWSALVGEGKIRAGESVLLQGTGGVSIFALQLAKLLGARVIVTSSRDEKLARCRELGADEGINYRETPDWGARARELTGGEGVDHVVEVGGGETFAQSLKAIKIGGTISVIGALTGGVAAGIPLTQILMQKVRVQGILVGSRDDFEAMNRAIALHGLRPVLDRAFAFEAARDAFEHMAGGSHFGKIVIRVG